jgi:integrase
MAWLTVRGNFIYLGDRDEVTGQPRTWSTGCRVDERAAAEKVLREYMRTREQKKGVVAAPSATMSFRQYGEIITERRRGLMKNGVKQEERHLRNHAYPLIGDISLAAFTSPMLLEFVRKLQLRSGAEKGGQKLSPRYVKNVSVTVKMVFSEAVDEGLIPATPCTWKARKHLPKIRDVDSTRRHSGVFRGWEVHQLIYDTRIPEDRRVIYALEFLTGMRPGEVAARRFRELNFRAKPLGQIAAETAWSSDNKREGSNKTDVMKLIPVHPMLKAILEAWWNEGWARWRGRAPTADDLIIPGQMGGFRTASKTNRDFQAMLDRLGLRKRINYDARATFRSLIMSVRPDLEALTEKITHQRPKDIRDVYNRTEVLWPKMCEAVLALPIRPKEPGDDEEDHLGVEGGFEGPDPFRTGGADLEGVAATTTEAPKVQ